MQFPHYFLMDTDLISEIIIFEIYTPYVQLLCFYLFIILLQCEKIVVHIWWLIGNFNPSIIGPIYMSPISDIHHVILQTLGNFEYENI